MLSSAVLIVITVLALVFAAIRGYRGQYGDMFWIWIAVSYGAATMLIIRLGQGLI